MQDKIKLIKAKKKALEIQLKSISKNYVEDPEPVAQLELAIRIYQDVLDILSMPSEKVENWMEALDAPSLKENDIANLKRFKKVRNGFISFQFEIRGEAYEATATYEKYVLNLCTLSKVGEEGVISLSSDKGSIRNILHTELILNRIIGTQYTFPTET
ncbi:hypothetical protein P5616_027810 (plasmid) [Priestia aryabhattai]|uniref:hypothetical protein n=1 Tax=Priestia aryabhattai TaxID=412384 RepID=UPI001CCCF5FF|nr:hypothetical protein [Priestia aryabhattai]MBZ6485166.1 hypothetical protein [Priestia aryabhattai]MDH3130132.1 hypothetical protein [Priestia aryabhattai]